MVYSRTNKIDNLVHNNLNGSLPLRQVALDRYLGNPENIYQQDNWRTGTWNN